MKFALPRRSCIAAALAAFLATGFVSAAGAESVAVAELAVTTHIHGLSVDRAKPGHLWIATHHGLYRADPKGNAERVSPVQDFMGFNAHPADGAILYASGHPATGGNLGFLVSTDQGQTWTQVSPGASGPVDFHQMTVSPADGNTIYGAYRGIQLSRDGGRTWNIAGPAPAKLIDLSASAADANTLYAATEYGLARSRNAGATFAMVMEGAPVSLVEAGPGGIFAFVLGRGMLRAAGDGREFEIVSPDVGARFLLHLAIDPADPARLYAATNEGAIIASSDGGRNWRRFGGD